MREQEIFPHRGLVAFRSGGPVSTLTYDLLEAAFESGGETFVVGVFLAGAMIYVLGGSLVALVPAVGFICALLLSRLTP